MIDGSLYTAGMADNRLDTSTPEPHDLIDWWELRRSLEWDAEAQNAALLRQRAEQYAAPQHSRDSVADTLHVLTFTLGGEQYAVDVMLVQSVRTLGTQKIMLVPATPRFYRGVVNLRGQIITVLDIRRFFDLPESTSEPPRELVVVRSNGLELGLIARHVQGVQRVPAESVRPFEQLRYARGVTAERLVILDIARLFEDERLIIKHAEE